MTAPKPPANALDAESLLGIVDCAITLADLPGGLTELCARVADVVGAGAVAIITDTGAGPPSVLALSTASEPTRAQIEIDVPAYLAAAQAFTGSMRAQNGEMVVPIPGEGAVVVLGIGDRAMSAWVRLAAQLAADRAGAALVLARACADLDRTLARMLESDERLVGRIGLDIHDGPTQHLSVGLLEVQLLQAQMGDAIAAGTVLPEGLEASLDRIYETLGGALTEMRELIGYLRPARFQGRRLTEILGDVVTAFEARSGVDVQFDQHGAFPVDGVSVTQRITFYRILQEALTNAQRHGQADVVRVELIDDDAGTTLTVIDNGSGFDPVPFSQAVLGSSIARFGLHGMRNRTTMLGGTFDILSALGQGCTLRVHLPRWSPTAASDPDGY
jgi:signal transduction histidine kinase